MFAAQLAPLSAAPTLARPATGDIERLPFDLAAGSLDEAEHLDGRPVRCTFRVQAGPVPAGGHALLSAGASADGCERYVAVDGAVAAGRGQTVTVDGRLRVTRVPARTVRGLAVPAYTTVCVAQARVVG